MYNIYNAIEDAPMEETPVETYIARLIVSGNTKILMADDFRVINPKNQLKNEDIELSETSKIVKDTRMIAPSVSLSVYYPIGSEIEYNNVKYTVVEYRQLIGYERIIDIVLTPVNNDYVYTYDDRPAYYSHATKYFNEMIRSNDMLKTVFSGYSFDPLIYTKDFTLPINELNGLKRIDFMKYAEKLEMNYYASLMANAISKETFIELSDKYKDVFIDANEVKFTYSTATAVCSLYTIIKWVLLNRTIHEDFEFELKNGAIVKMKSSKGMNDSVVIELYTDNTYEDNYQIEVVHVLPYPVENIFYDFTIYDIIITAVNKETSETSWSVSLHNTDIQTDILETELSKELDETEYISNTYVDYTNSIIDKKYEILDAQPWSGDENYNSVKYKKSMVVMLYYMMSEILCCSVGEISDIKDNIEAYIQSCIITDESNDTSSDDETIDDNNNT